MKYSLLLFWLLPAVTFAQASTGSLQELLVGIGGFLNAVVIPFILAIAFIVFVVNVVRFFVIGGASDEGQKNAKNLAVYGIAAFVFILSFWGIVNMLVDGVGLTGDPCYPVSDYVNREGSTCPPPDIITTPPPPPTPPPDLPPIIPPPDLPPIILPTPPPPTPPDLPYGSFSDVLAIEDEVRRLATNYLETNAKEDFGNNTAGVGELLFADFANELSHLASITPSEHAKAIYRLGELGVVPRTLLNEYLESLQIYYDNQGFGQTVPTLTEIQSSLAVPLPNSLIDNMFLTRDEFYANLEPITSPIQAQNITDALYDSHTSPDDRFALMEDLFFAGGNYPPWLSLDSPVHNELYQKFADDINAEKVFNGDYELTD